MHEAQTFFQTKKKTLCLRSKSITTLIKLIRQKSSLLFTPLCFSVSNGCDYGNRFVQGTPHLLLRRYNIFFFNNQSNCRIFDPTDGTYCYKYVEIPPCPISIEDLTKKLTVMAQKWAQVNWSRGQYSDVFCSAIIDPSPLKQGQKVKVIWGKSRKEYRAIVGFYPLEPAVQCDNQENKLAPRKAKAKRKLVSVCFSFARV